MNPNFIAPFKNELLLRTTRFLSHTIKCFVQFIGFSEFFLLQILQFIFAKCIHFIYPRFYLLLPKEHFLFEIL